MGSPVPEDIKSIVVFIYLKNATGKAVPNGTGFFAGVKKPDSDSVSVYLVTAKHVLFDPDTNDFYPEIVLRLNRKNGGADSGILPLKGDKALSVFTHSEDSVDLAAIPFLPDQSKYDFKILTEDFITTKENYKELKIREGSDVFFAGLFTPYLGADKNYPVIRFGRVALTTDEKIDWGGKKMDLYLMEVASYGGNSGSPVFFYLGSDRDPGSLIVGAPVLKLAGIMQGTFQDMKEIQFIETKQTPISVSNMGIAAVVPAYKLHEILFSDEAKKKRGF